MVSAHSITVLVVLILSFITVSSSHPDPLSIAERDGAIGVCGNPPVRPGKDRMSAGKLRRVSQEVLRSNAERLKGQRILVKINFVYDEMIEERWSKLEGGVIQYLRLLTYSTQLVFEQKELDLGIELVVVSAKKSTQKFQWDWNSGKILDEFTGGPDLDRNADINVYLLGRSLWNRGPKVENSKRWSTRILGLSWVRSFCNPNSTVGAMLVDAIELGRYRTFAHEIAHALGCNHDGEKSDPILARCDSNLYLMSWANSLSRVAWSECTKTCLTQFFAHPDVYKCIIDRQRVESAKPMTPEFDFSPHGTNPNRQKFPGEILDIDGQCRHASDDNARALQSITGRNGYVYDNTCQGLLCRLGDVNYLLGHVIQGSTCIVTKNNQLLTGKCFGIDCIV